MARYHIAVRPSNSTTSAKITFDKKALHDIPVAIPWSKYLISSRTSSMMKYYYEKEEI